MRARKFQMTASMWVWLALFVILTLTYIFTGLWRTITIWDIGIGFALFLFSFVIGLAKSGKNRR